MVNYKSIFPKEKSAIDGQFYENDPLDVLSFPTRVLNTLVMHGYETVGDFYHATNRDLKKIRNIGTKTLKYFIDIKKVISEYQHGQILPSRKIIKAKSIYPQRQPRNFTPYLSEIEKERMKLVKRLYDEYGTLDKVGGLLRLTRERVRQILNKGQKYGLFTYQLTRDKKFDEALNKVNKEQLKELIRTTKNQFDISSKLGIDINTLQRLIKYHSIDLESYRQDASYRRYLIEYSEIVKILGYHPSTTVLQRNKKWRKIAVGIDRLWGGFDRFRSEFGIEKPKHSIHPNTLIAWNLAKERRMTLKKEKVANVFKIVETSGPISCKKISEITGYRNQSTLLYLNNMIAENRIKRIGNGIKIRYKVGVK